MVSSNTTIWFVDERFKRKTIAPTQKQMTMELRRRVFYAKDRRYVEVMGNAFPLDHDQWELLPQKILGMTAPPMCEPFGTGHHMWTWAENFLEDKTGLWWSGEWFIRTIQHYIKTRAKACVKAGAKAPYVEGLDVRDDTNINETVGSERVFIGTEGKRFGILACEFF
ncbi:uncharacterized protein TRIVIDRAFT_223675 [Trichoderma virens Gv29-8]|uniref:Uncharacterized protein n=1 Tax=Hypocrea virens (strain Gv29-8 / FGSC 10586) TaxID=413071 RepID=G9MXU7_HYPVG|nr:uncharacterized protein TRIVIDRAFT_223675 [Trichoderma virens Gv29-8]EHK20708.1 hypothetical protein TRIVIDRAFT_223675 [Trichoderma virens Gv29-8]